MAENDVFYGSDKIVGTVGGGIGGSNNWMQSSAIVPAQFYGTVQGTDPGFINRVGRDVRLVVGSGCRNHGLNAVAYLDRAGAVYSGLPTLEYVNPLGNRTRPNDGQIDLGAYEYGVPLFKGIKVNGKDCVLDFTAEAGNLYDLQGTSDPGSNLWTPVMTNIPGADSTIQIIDTNAVSQPKRFYRVKSSM
jgi:hypothetical protein